MNYSPHVVKFCGVSITPPFFIVTELLSARSVESWILDATLHMELALRMRMCVAVALLIAVLGVCVCVCVRVCVFLCVCVCAFLGGLTPIWKGPC